ncbi:Membrane protein OxaA [Mycoplasma suis KI3806]|nr:Membrane protein OxaA [Mycoplasma suis KI3806]
MISWSFFQSMFTSYVFHSNEAGVGLEAAYHSGSSQRTNDLRYDAFPWTPNPWAYWPLVSSGNGFGPFIMWLVYPFTRVFLYLIWTFRGTQDSFMDKSGLNVVCSILIILLVMKSIVFLTIFRAQYYSDLQQRHKKNLERIKSKYTTDKFDRKELRTMSVLRQQEVSRYCKKHGLKPFSALENFFINTPIFLVIYKLMTITRPVKFSKLFGIMPFSKTPINMIFTDFLSVGWVYILFFAIAIPVNLYSQKIPSRLMKKRFPSLQDDVSLKVKDINVLSSKKLQNIISVSLIIFSLFWSTSLAVYYFFNSLFNIAFSYIIHSILKKRKEKESALTKKLKNLGI